MDAKELFTWAWLGTFICLSCSGYKLETCFLWKNLFCSCCWEVTGGTPWFFQPVLLGHCRMCVGSPPCPIQCRGHCGTWSLVILLPPSPCCGLPKREAQEPTAVDLTVISRQGAHARHAAAVVCEEGVIWGRGWIFTAMEGGKGGVFANNP